MSAGFDMAALDRHLEELLELDADARAVRLQAIAAGDSNSDTHASSISQHMSHGPR